MPWRRELTPRKWLDPAEQHLLSIDELAAKLGTSLDANNAHASRGLSAEEAAHRLQRDGPNVLVEPRKDPEWLKFARQFQDKLLLLLIIAGVLACVAFGIDTAKVDGYTNIILAACLFAIVLVTGCMTYAQERATAKILAQIHALLAATCVVIRDGEERRIDAQDLVVGDLVRLGTGDRVPADLRVIATSELRTERSGITGESAPVKATAGQDPPGTLALQSRALVFNSSLCVIGEGLGVVIRTGNRTVIGSIASLASDTAGSNETLLQKEVKHFVFFIAGIAFLTSCTFFIIGMARAAVIYHHHIPRAAFLNAFINGLIILLVAFVPEGLPATLTSLLAITAKRMAQRHVLVKKLSIVESLGCATCICSDKTGTLTCNVMTVEHLWYNRAVYSAASGKPHLLEQMAAVAATHRQQQQEQELVEQLPRQQLNLAGAVTDAGGPERGDLRRGQHLHHQRPIGGATWQVRRAALAPLQRPRQAAGHQRAVQPRPPGC